MPAVTWRSSVTQAQGFDMSAHRRTVGLWLLVFIWLLAATTLAVPETGWNFGRLWAAGGVVPAVLSSLLWRFRGDSRMTRFGLAGALISLIWMLTAHGTVAPWRDDGSACFAMALALLAAFTESDVLIFGTVLVLLHHLGAHVLELGPGDSTPPDLAQTLLRSGLVLLEASALVWLAIAMGGRVTAMRPAVPHAPDR